MRRQLCSSFDTDSKIKTPVKDEACSSAVGERLDGQHIDFSVRQVMLQASVIQIT